MLQKIFSAINEVRNQNEDLKRQIEDLRIEINEISQVIFFGKTPTCIEEDIALKLDQESMTVDGNTSDGYHTFNELYEFRKVYNAALFNEWSTCNKYHVHKSWRHNDGELCFGGGWFIVVAVLPKGQISNHYEAKDWNLFQIQETDNALFEFDGHTSADVIKRLNDLIEDKQC